MTRQYIFKRIKNYYLNISNFSSWNLNYLERNNSLLNPDLFTFVMYLTYGLLSRRVLKYGALVQHLNKSIQIQFKKFNT